MIDIFDKVAFSAYFIFFITLIFGALIVHESERARQHRQLIAKIIGNVGGFALACLVIQGLWHIWVM